MRLNSIDASHGVTPAHNVPNGDSRWTMFGGSYHGYRAILCDSGARTTRRSRSPEANKSEMTALCKQVGPFRLHRT